MFKLSVAKYADLREQISAIPFNTYFAQAVLDRKVDGEIYVNDEFNPTAGYILHPYGMSLLFGRMDDEQFNQDLINYLLSDKIGNDEYLQVYPLEWATELNLRLADYIVSDNASAEERFAAKVIDHVRVNFKFKRDSYLLQYSTVSWADYELRSFTGDQFELMTGSVVAQYFWRNAQEFDDMGKAYALYMNNEVASVAFTSCCDNAILELGIETRDKYRGRGLAKVVCLKLVEYALENDLEPVWACRKGNLGSYKLAQQLGFEVACELPYYQIKRQTK